MTTPRLTSDLLVSQMLRRCTAAGVGVQIARRGDPSAGAIVVKLIHATFGANSQVFEFGWREDGQRGWRCATGPDPVPEYEADDYLARQIKYDSDLWVIDIEDPKARPWWDETFTQG